MKFLTSGLVQVIDDGLSGGTLNMIISGVDKKDDFLKLKIGVSDDWNGKIYVGGR